MRHGEENAQQADDGNTDPTRGVSVHQNYHFQGADHLRKFHNCMTQMP